MKRITFLPLLLLTCASCGNSGEGDGSGAGSGHGDAELDADGYNTAPIEGLSIDEVYFAQTHVLRTTDPTFLLTGNRDTLLKVQVLAPGSPLSPKVEAELRVGDASEIIVLEGPGELPAEFADEPGVVQHTGEDSFIAVIPKEMVQPGLEVTVRTGSEEWVEDVEVGAPNPMNIKMFDIHFFAHSDGDHDYPEGFLEEWAAKLPVSEMPMSRVKDAVFKEMIIPAREGAELPLVKVGSREEYQEKLGVPFDGEATATRQWQTALTRANGLNNTGLRWLNIIGVLGSGSGGGFGGVGGFGQLGLFHHEIGHAFGLGHLQSEGYPYRGDMHGIQAPDSEVHVGPTWGFDLASETFLPPVNQTRLEETGEQVYKQDPMRGGGSGDQEEPFFLRHFSDYNVMRMHHFITGKLAVRRDGQFYKWSEEDADYTRLDSTPENVGIEYPLEENVEVVSLMAGCFLGEGYEEINLIYPPMGPYVGNLMSTFDPSAPEDREDALARGYCPTDGCDYTLRVVQGGETSHYMLAASGSAADDPFEYDDLTTRAINVPTSDGLVTQMTLLHTPNAEVDGLPASPEELATFDNPIQPVVFDEAPADFFEDFEAARGVEYDAVEWTETQFLGTPLADTYSEVDGVLDWVGGGDAGNKHWTLNNQAVHGENAVISVEMGATDAAGERSIYFFFVDEYHHYQLLFTQTQSLLFKVEAGLYTKLGEGTGQSTNALTEWQITTRDDGNIVVTRDGEAVILAQVDGGFGWGGGRVALGAFGRRARWDNLSVVTE